MGNRLYVANIPFAATAESLTAHFSQAGAVTDVQIMLDKVTGRSRGFAFVTMAADADVAKAIGMFHGQPFEGRPLTVSEARPREERPAGGPRRDFGASGGGGGEPRSFGGGNPGGGGGGGGGRRSDRGSREKGDRFDREERGERRDRRDQGGGGGRRFSRSDFDDGDE